MVRASDSSVAFVEEQENTVKSLMETWINNNYNIPFDASVLDDAMNADNLVSSGTGRKLLDTYAESLINVHRLYNREFGTENRKVPAHVPHFIDR